MSHDPSQRRTLSLVVMLLGLASLLVWVGSAADFALVRTRTTRTLRVDDSDLAHEHTATPTVSCSTQATSSISASSEKKDSGGFESFVLVRGASPNVLDAGWAPLSPAVPEGRHAVFAGFSHSLRGPPYLS